MSGKPYTKKQEEWLIQNRNTWATLEELKDHFNETFNENRSKCSISDKCCKQLRLKGLVNTSKYGAKPKEQLPIGTIRETSNGVTYIKVENVPNGTCFTGYEEPYWLPIQKKIYQDYYGKIPNGTMVCFLDGNRNNLDISNLYCIDRKISAILSHNRWWTESREHTLTAIKWCELWYAMKENRNA